MMKSQPITLVGILNVTPDSFSDGGLFLKPEDAVAKAKQLIDDGAEVIDIGGVSTRPGSTPVSVDEEWRRLKPVLEQVCTICAGRCTVSVDTFRASIAHEAINLGARMINDVTAGYDPELFAVVADSDAKLVLMHSRCHTPHSFDPHSSEDIVTRTIHFLTDRIGAAKRSSIRDEQLIIDPGMGAFVSDDPAESWELIHRFGKLTDLGYPLYFGSSRKGFLRREGETSVSERDPLSALTGVLVAQQVAQRVPLFLRVHNVSMQGSFLDAAGK